MTADILKIILKDTKIYMDPDHPEYIEREKLQKLLPPFMEIVDEERQFFADGIAYFRYHHITVRLYSDRQDSPEEELLDGIFDECELNRTKESEFIPELKLWETTYTTEVQDCE